MYRQIRIDSSQLPLHRILWRADSTQPLQTYELQTVTFGTASAPYLATRTLKQLAIDEIDNYPNASVVTQRDFYVDDILTGSDNIIDLIELQTELTSMLNNAGFVLHKWCTNCPELLSHICQTESSPSNNLSSTECIKALGLSWKPQEDCFVYQIPDVKQQDILTKRYITSEVAKLFDPLGFLTPVMTTAKVLIQQLWKLNIGWDDIVPEETQTIWRDFQSNLSCLEDIKIDRKMLCDNPKSIQLHGFADSSERAYGACLYLRSVDQLDNITVNLVCSKSRVAPLKIVSLPRLELCSALLLSQLTKRVTDSLELNIDQTYLWSDSQITLAWINTEPHKLKTFIANRVSEIQDLTSNSVWRHVSTHDNPADVISRGTMPQFVKDHSLWWNGPSFLHTDFTVLKPSVAEHPKFDDDKFEFKKEYSTMLTYSTTNDLIERYSSYGKLLRVAAYGLRFKNNCLNKDAFLTGPPSVEELENALLSLVKFVQRQHFSEEISLLSKGRNISIKSKILSLNPFLDSQGVLRVGGRLQNSDIEYDHKHQILIPSSGHFTTILFRQYHIDNMHVGPQQLVSIIKHKFWPIAATNLAKKCVRTCIKCFKYKPQICQQIMGTLPAERVQTKNPTAFDTTGIDFCGPFLVKNKQQRNSSPYKVYVAIFVCFLSKGVHLEIVTDLTTKCFLQCLSRFINRRGKPSVIFTDNGKTFVGAKNELKRIQTFLQSKTTNHEIQTSLASQGITWKFIPPRAPNFGGLWESNVKSLKTHLKKVIANVHVSYDELETLLIQVEGIMNSRPLTLLSSDPSDPLPLLPSHFLIGKPIVTPPELGSSDIPSNFLTSWRKITQMCQNFWSRFSNEYIHSLQQRNKWRISSPNLKQNDLVLLCDDSCPSTQWLMGIIKEIVKGPDDKVRVVHIKTKNGIFVRSLSKICKFPLEIDE